MSLKTRISEDMKTALRARETARLGAIRLLLAAIKQKEVDDRKDLDDTDIINIIDKMLKQRRDSIAQFGAAGREDLVCAEQFEIDVIKAYMPQALSSVEVHTIIDEAVTACGARGMPDMGKVMAIVKTKLAGRADMTEVSTMVKAMLTSL